MIGHWYKWSRWRAGLFWEFGELVAEANLHVKILAHGDRQERWEALPVRIRKYVTSPDSENSIDAKRCNEGAYAFAAALNA